MENGSWAEKTELHQEAAMDKPKDIWNLEGNKF
jgi:hypothetical protein